MLQVRRRNLQPPGHGSSTASRCRIYASGSVNVPDNMPVTHIKTEPHTAVPHIPCNVCHHAGLIIQHILDADFEITGLIPHELPPEFHGSVMMPFLEIHEGYIPGMNNHLIYSRLKGNLRSLIQSLHCQRPGPGINCRRVQLIKGSMQNLYIVVFHKLPKVCLCIISFNAVHVLSLTEGVYLNSHSVFISNRLPVAAHGGYKQSVL